ncbi:ribosomal RNA adenine dimethylase family protein, putative [Bodo saltans]|uniref:rRNA adenine N(6)-methyltransferase n=1 Tax=Bodo saltans TaxID=75058 RepID=A0A0S4JJ91_BODSA|nr:ribosomal RNA adenine dimethylase family protein, putative [Bodo saltans]|eukprot:CUG90224.1 ribosomal RNA adenine dimethylase family protein, putative [Bodo saltans]
MPKERRPVPMGLISAEPLHTTKSKLKFSTKIVMPGQSVKIADKSKDKKAKGAHGVDGQQSGMVFNKGHGQHILKNPLVISAIVEKSAIKSTDIVLEIGPGTGNLTEKLLLAAKKVIAFEIDPRMVAELNKRFQNSPLWSKLEIIKGNCLDFDFPYFDKCVANVPYAISSALVFKLLKNPTFKCAVLMFQREFALRCCALPGSEAYCRLSVNTQLLSRCSHLMKISKNSFNPPPKVESSVIRLDPKHPPPPVDFEEWDGLVKLIFNRKNKKVSSIFRTKVTIAHLYERFVSYQTMEGVAPTAIASVDVFKELLSSVVEDKLFAKRGRSLDQEDISTMLDLFTSKGIHFI